MSDLEANFKVILDSKSVIAMLQELANLVGDKHSVQQDKWIDGNEAMRIMKISKNTLQKLRDNRAIKFSTPPDIEKIYYDRDSIMEYFEKHSKIPE